MANRRHRELEIIDIEDPAFEEDSYDRDDTEYEDDQDTEYERDYDDRYDDRYDHRGRDREYQAYDDRDRYDGRDYDASYEDDYDDRDVHDRKNRRRGKGSSIVSFLILILILSVLFFSAYKFMEEFLTYKAASDEYTLVKEKIVIPEDDAMVDEGGITYPDLAIDLDALYATNPDFVCVIYIPALELYYPVAHSHDNSEYLRTTFEGTTNPSGCIFLDANASEDFTDNNTFIYGHNMKNETMFGILKEFSKQDDLCVSNPYVYLYLRDGSVLKYHIFAYYTTPVNDELYDSFSGDEAYDAYVTRAQARSYYTPAEEETDDFTLRPNLLTLSTCWGTDHKNNFVVQSALIGKADRAVEVTEDVQEGTAATAN